MKTRRITLAKFQGQNSYSNPEDFETFFQNLGKNNDFIAFSSNKCYSFYKNHGRGFLLTFWGQANPIYCEPGTNGQNPNEMIYLLHSQRANKTFKPFSDEADKLHENIWSRLEEPVRTYDPEYQYIVAGLDYFPTVNNRLKEVAVSWFIRTSFFPLAEYVKEFRSISQYKINAIAARMKESQITSLELDMRLALFRDNLHKWIKALKDAEIRIVINSSRYYPIPKSLLKEKDILVVNFE